MNIAELFIKRPVMTTLAMAAILLFGSIGYLLLPVSDLPSVDFPTLVVNASLPGASPETMSTAVALPLERYFSTIAGVDSMSSSSSLGYTSITLQFSLDRNIDSAALDVQSMITRSARDLPADMPNPPSFRKVNPADQPVLRLVLSSATMKLSDLDEYAETMLAQRISMINGVAQVDVMGGQKYAVRALLDPRSLASRQVGINEVVNAIQAANSNQAVGNLYGDKKAYTLETNGQLMNADAYRPIIVAYRNGAPVRLSDLGDVLDSVENDKTAAWDVTPEKATRSISLSVQRQPGTNTVKVVDSVRKLMDSLKAEIPPSVHVEVLYDRSQSIRASVDDVKFTLKLTVFLVVLVIFLFLRNLSATVIPSMALPMSLVGTFAVMYLLNYSVDNMSMMALTLSVGFVVDDAIVMLENIVRHMEKGEPPLRAALIGSREISFTILSMTLSLAAVFIPVLFMAGVLGRVLHEFAVTIMSSILVSGLVSLSLTPMLASRFLRPVSEQKHGRLYRASESAFNALLHLYDRTLVGVMRYRAATMALSLVVLVATVYMFKIVPKGFLPSEDTGQVIAQTEAAQDVSFDELVRLHMRTAKVLQKNPYVEHFTASTRGSNTGMFFLKLKDREQRPHVDQVMQQLRPQLAKVANLRVFMQNPPPIRIGGMMTKSQYQYTLQGPNTQELYASTQLLESKLSQLPDLVDVTTDLQLRNPRVHIDIDRDKAAAMGVSVSDVEQSLSSAYSARQVTTIMAPNNAYKVIVKVADEFQTDPNLLSMLHVRTKDGRLIPLNELASMKQTVGPLTVNHFGQLPATTVSFSVRPGVSLGDAVNQVSDVAHKTLPDTIIATFQGTAKEFEKSLTGLGLLLIAAILVIYIVLGILYESFIHPITILSGLPSAGFGALLTLMIFRMDLDLYAFVGIIMLIGIVKKNAIMMIDFALENQRKAGLSPEEAIYQGCLVRFRPIMMTTMAALMGTLPIALGMGAGSESRRPLGVAVVGGLVFSQLLTLYITPVVYTYMESFQQWLRRLRKKQAVTIEDVEAEVKREEQQIWAD